jgi:hypothetical protein
VHRPAAGGAPGGGGGLAIAAVRANFSDYSKKKKKCNTSCMNTLQQNSATVTGCKE